MISSIRDLTITETELRFLDATGRIIEAARDPEGRYPLSTAFETLDMVRNDLGADVVASLLAAVQSAEPPPLDVDDFLPQALEPLDANLRWLDVPDAYLGASSQVAVAQIARAMAEASQAEAVNSFAFAQASGLELRTVGSAYALVDTLPISGAVVLLCTDQDPTLQDRQLVWAIGFVGELLLGILALASIPVKGGNAISKVVRRILKNERLRGLLEGLIAGITSVKLLEFLKALYDEGLLGFALSELVADLGFFALLAIIAGFLSYFVPGAGQARLLIGLAALGIDLGVKLYKRPTEDV